MKERTRKEEIDQRNPCRPSAQVNSQQSWGWNQGRACSSQRVLTSILCSKISTNDTHPFNEIRKSGEGNRRK